MEGFIDRGPAARSTRTELLGDRVRGYMSGCLCQRKYTARLRQEGEWAVVFRDVVVASATTVRVMFRRTTRLRHIASVFDTELTLNVGSSDNDKSFVLLEGDRDVRKECAQPTPNASSIPNSDDQVHQDLMVEHQ